jgi:hypothetical protein
MACFEIEIDGENHAFHVSNDGGPVRYCRNPSPRRWAQIAGWTQICGAGGFQGYAITADADTLEMTARKWLRRRLSAESD